MPKNSGPDHWVPVIARATAQAQVAERQQPRDLVETLGGGHRHGAEAVAGDRKDGSRLFTACQNSIESE
jgi:hypothetical protein